MARLLEDGTALSYLERACPQQRFAVCAQLDELNSYRPTIISFGDSSVEMTLTIIFFGPALSRNSGGPRAEQARI